MKKKVLIFFSFASLFAGGQVFAQPRVYTVPVVQGLTTPAGRTNFENAQAVAIDGDSIIVIDGGALLYRRDASGRWNYSRTLIADPGAGGARDVVMKNSLAIIKVGATATIWEKVGGQWVQGATAAPITGPGGFAISTNRIMVGADGCAADALIYQRVAAGIWDITGRIPPDDGSCANTARPVELNYDNALVRGSGNILRSYRRDGSALVWRHFANLTVTDGPTAFRLPPALQSDTLVVDDLNQYRRSSIGWTSAGRVVPLNFPNGAGDQGPVLYRDNVLLVNDLTDVADVGRRPYLYVKNAQGSFDHVGILGSPFGGPMTIDFDLSGSTAVGISQSGRGTIINELAIYKLPVNLVRPRAIANNFDARDIGDFATTPGSEYALAGNQYNYLYRQSNRTADTAAVLANSDWTDYQSVEAVVKANAFARPDAWLGLAIRYVDENNHYFVSLGNDDVLRLQRKVDGVTTTLTQAPQPVDIGAWHHVRLVAAGSRLQVYFDGDIDLEYGDTALSHGEVALLTSGARADFDNLIAKSTGGFSVFNEEPPYQETRRDYSLYGGTWTSGFFDDNAGLRQSDTSGQAIAVQGVSMDDQSITADVTLDTFATTSPVSWYGVVTRFVDPNNYYFLSVRSSNQVQIRKVVNGVSTVLKAVTFNAVPGDSQRLEFRAIGNELTAWVDGVIVARAVDDDLSRGRFGLATYRAGATYTLISAQQP